MTDRQRRLSSPPKTAKKGGLPSLDVRRIIPVAYQPKNGNGKLPNASLIYGIGAAALMTICLYFLFTGMWLTSLLLMLPAGCLLGFALHYLRYHD
jgi:hypothetical protein